MTDSLKKLYNQVILDRLKDEAGFKKRENAEVVVEAYNPVCGDKFKLFLDFDGDTISQASYHGYGCALSKASTSLLVQSIKDTNILEFLEIIENYFKMLKEDSEGTDQLIKALAMARKFPGREQCTTLSWEAVRKYLENRSAE